VEEAIAAATINAAVTIRRAETIGSLEPGKAADILVMNVPNYLHLVYHPGVNHVSSVIKEGEVVVEEGRLNYLDTDPTSP